MCDTPRMRGKGGVDIPGLTSGQIGKGGPQMVERCPFIKARLWQARRRSGLDPAEHQAEQVLLA